jgi:hypothetical protein
MQILGEDPGGFRLGLLFGGEEWLKQVRLPEVHKSLVLETVCQA